MGLSIMSVIVMSIGTLFALFFIIVLIVGRKYDGYLKDLDKKEFMLSETYGFGLVLLDMLHYRYSSKRERDRRKEVQLLYSEKYSDYYLSILAAQRITLPYLLGVGGFILFGLTNDITILAVMLMFTFAAYSYCKDRTTREIKKRSNKLMGDFSEMVSKLALLINAGMIMKEAWYKVAEGGQGLLYEEMRTTVIDMENNMSEVDAYLNFSRRCVVPEIKKFTSMVLQGLIKGNKEFSLMIKDQSKEIWLMKQEHVRQQGEKAASKLLIPICIMFVGILIMIIVPIFANLGVS